MKDFVKEMKFDNVVDYKKPCIITLSGSPGSGKTYVAKKLSKELGVYVLSNDYVRNYFYEDKKKLEFKNIQQRVKKINRKRLLKILFNCKSFVYDADLNTKKSYKKFFYISKLLNYKLIKIRINSNDDCNIKRIQKRVMDFNKIDKNVIGDNVNYSPSWKKEVYYQIKERKPRYVDDGYFDYVIENNGTKQEFDNEIQKLTTDIGKTLVLKKSNKKLYK